MTKIFINIPVSDLPKATAFYEAIGFTKNSQFSDDKASGMSYNDEFYVMLLSHDFTKTFIGTKQIADSHQTCEVVNAIQLDTKDAVNELFNKAIAAGGKDQRDAYDHGFMFGHAFEDLDGHIREPFWMDATQMPAQE